MKVLKKFIKASIKHAVQDDDIVERGKYGVNFYKPKKDKDFMSQIARKNPFAYYLMQTQIPNEYLKEDTLGTRIGRIFSGSITRKRDPNTGILSNRDYGSNGNEPPKYGYKPEYIARNLEQIRRDIKRVNR